MEILSISEVELKIIMDLATRFVVMNKSTLFMVPEYNVDDNAHQRALLLEKAVYAGNLEKMELLLDVTAKEDFAELRSQLKVKAKRNVKLYLLSPLGLAMYRSDDDVWTENQKQAYTDAIVKREQDRVSLEKLAADKLAEKSK